MGAREDVVAPQGALVDDGGRVGGVEDYFVAQALARCLHNVAQVGLVGAHEAELVLHLSATRARARSGTAAWHGPAMAPKHGGTRHAAAAEEEGDEKESKRTMA